MTTGGPKATRASGPSRWFADLTKLHRLNRAAIWWIAGVSIVGAVWWWPAVTSRPDDIDVELVIGEGLAVADQSIERRLREEGFRVSRPSRPLDWCSVPGLVDSLSPESTRLVIWAEVTTQCDLDAVVEQVVERARDRRLIVVRLPTDTTALESALAGQNVVTVDTRRLLGEPGQTMECVWWEDCPASGTIDPWIDGRLGPIGGERVARMIVTAAS